MQEGNSTTVNEDPVQDAIQEILYDLGRGDTLVEKRARNIDQSFV